jgi:UDP-N-acetylglucosamine:LPS N-acetylglucosamine transferase
LHVVRDANRWEKWALLKMFLQIAWTVVKVRPDIVLTTGAAPGFAAIVFGRMVGAKTLWLDSIANVEEMSQSGILARKWAHVWLTQWPDLAKPDGPGCWGAVL